MVSYRKMLKGLWGILSKWALTSEKTVLQFCFSIVFCCRLWCFEHHKQRAILFPYTGDKADLFGSEFKLNCLFRGGLTSPINYRAHWVRGEQSQQIQELLLPSVE